MPSAPAFAACRASSMECVVVLVPTPATIFARSPTAAITAASVSPSSSVVVVGDSPVVPETTRPSWPCSTRWRATFATPSRSTDPSGLKGVTIAVSIRPKGAADWVMTLRLVPPPSQLRRDLGCDEVEVFEVGQIEQLQVDPLGAEGGVPAHLLGDLRGGAGQAVLAQLADLAADRGGAAADLGLVASAAQHQRRGQA